jgi:hypothetical protein
MADRHKIIFVSVTLHAHGSNLLGSFAKLSTPVDRLSYAVRGARYR